MKYTLSLLLLCAAVAAPPLPESEPVLENVNHLVQAEQFKDFTSFKFVGKLSVQILDLDVSDCCVWIATTRGIVRYIPADGSWSLIERAGDVAAERVSNIAVGKHSLAVDLASTHKGAITQEGVYLYNLKDSSWRYLAQSSWSLAWEGDALWMGSHAGARRYGIAGKVEAESPDMQSFTRENSGLQHNVVHEIQVHGSTVWFATLGSFVKAIDEFAGGGVSVVDRKTGEWKSYTSRDGLARDYCSSLGVDQDEAWVVHWHTHTGVSILDRHTRKWRVLKKTSNGIDTGGVLVTLDPQSAWVGQQRGLLRIDRKNLNGTLYTEADGLPGRIFSAVVVSGDSLWASAYTYAGKNAIHSGIIRFPLRSILPR